MGFIGVEKKLNGRLRKVSKVFQGCFKEILGVSRQFQKCLKKVLSVFTV